MATSALDIINAIRNSASADYQAYIPEATRENITEVGNTLVGQNANNPHFNAFFSNLINRIGKVVIDKVDGLDDYYTIFRQGEMDMGDTIQRIFIELPKAKNYNGTATTEMLQQERGTIHVEYTRIDRKFFYKTTLTVEEIREAFVNVSKLDEFVRAVIEAMYTALKMDLYFMMNDTLKKHVVYCLEKGTYYIGVEETDAHFDDNVGALVFGTTGAKALLKQLRKGSRAMKFPHELKYYDSDGTLAGTISRVTTPLNKQVVALETSVHAEIDVDALATLFNLEKAELQTRSIELEDGVLGRVEVAGTPYYVIGFICNKDAVYTEKTLQEADSFKNPESRAVNYWLHYWGLQAVSKFKDFIPVVVPVVE